MKQLSDTEKIEKIKTILVTHLLPNGNISMLPSVLKEIVEVVYYEEFENDKLNKHLI